jgi:hypothetical protein
VTDNNGPLRWQGDTIDWEVTREGNYLVAKGFYRDRLVTTIRSRRSWVLTLRIAVAHLWHWAVSR